MSTQWMFWGSGLVVAALGLALLAWALFADRSRGHKRCCKCWYSMARATSLRCPECGYEARSERKLFKTRRRWRWALASAIPLLLAAFLAVQPKVQRHGWGSVLPATVMILILRVDDRPWVIDGIQYHISSHATDFRYHPSCMPTAESLWNWQWCMLGYSALNAESIADSDDLHHLLWSSLTFGECRSLELDAAPTLFALLSHLDEDRRVGSMALLTGIAVKHNDTPEVFEAIRAMEQDVSEEVRFHRVRMLARLTSGDDRWKMIADALRCDDHPVRLGGIAVLAIESPDQWSPEVATLVVELLSYQDNYSRFPALRLMGVLSYHVREDHVPTLHSYLEHREPRVAHAARWLLDMFEERNHAE